MRDIEMRLVAYARRMLSAVTHAGEDVPALRGEPDWAAYERLLGEWGEPEDALSSIFSRVKAADDGEVPKAWYAARPLALERETLFPTSTIDQAQQGTNLQELWHGFNEEYATLQGYVSPDDDAFFEAFCHLFNRWAWALPCTYGEPGISLYEQWKAVAALYFASRGAEEPAGQFTLVGGDIPGIQDFVYTITSKGAAKGLRGRSLFLRLLGDAVVRRLLEDLELSPCNVVYDAGGNFMLLAPQDAEATVGHVRLQVNRRMIEAFQANTAFVLEAAPAEQAELFSPAAFARARDDLWKAVALAKNRPFEDVAMDKDGWARVFTFKDQGSKWSCAICHVEVGRRARWLEDPEPGEEIDEEIRPRICGLCASFAELARDIAHDMLWLTVRPAPGVRDTAVEAADGWSKLLGRIAGLRYEFAGTLPEDPCCALAISEPDFLKQRSCGFRLLANVTPVVTHEEVKQLREDADWSGEKIPRRGEIRSFELLARAAKQINQMGAIPRVGVLRMDVDGLGAAFSEGMPDMTLPALSAMSAAMERFFSGHLNRIVNAQSPNDLYVIYSGGDDLFIVGAWPHLPELAEGIHDAFKAFTGDHPDLSLSGGITLEGAHSPLYRAADRAGEAEGKAKAHLRPDGTRKDALCFLDTVVGWEEWPQVRQQKDELLWLIGERDNPQEERRLPRGLLQTVQRIYQLYRSDLAQARLRARAQGRPAPHSRLFFGRWMWAQVYYLTRLGRQHKKTMEDAPERMQRLQGQLLKHEMVPYSGLAARWAEYLSRSRQA